MSQAEDPVLLRRGRAREVSVEDVRRLMGASTPHFALQLRNRIAALIAGLPEDHPARVEGEREIARLQRLGLEGEVRGEAADTGEHRMPSLGLPGRRHGGAGLDALADEGDDGKHGSGQGRNHGSDGDVAGASGKTGGDTRLAEAGER